MMALRFGRCRLTDALESCRSAAVAGFDGTGVSWARLQQAFSHNASNSETNHSLSPSVDSFSRASALGDSSSGNDTLSQPTESPVSSEDLFPNLSQLPATGSTLRDTAASRGVFKAILLGQVGHDPVQRILKSGRAITMFTIGTGGLHTDKRGFEANLLSEEIGRGSIQWHRVAVHQERLGVIAYRVLKKGMQVYVEGNIESRVFNDPFTGAIKRVREVVLRQDGRLMFMPQPASSS